MLNEHLIIVAGGVGKRMQSEIPKQFVKVCGKEVIIHTIERFREYRSDLPIIISVHKNYFSFLHDLLQKKKLADIKIVEGGETRFQSVKNALETINDKQSVVAIHDAARPLVSVDTIKRCFALAREKGNAVPAISLHESIRENTKEGNRAVNRANFRIIQTPQCFLVSKIQTAFTQGYDEKFTDDASVLESVGETIYLAEGNPENIKITLPNDLLIAETFIRHEQRGNM